MKRCLILILTLILFTLPARGEEEEVSLFAGGSTAVPTASPGPSPAPAALPPADGARAELIDGIISEAKALFDKANGRPQRAHYAGDIYVCKNFTVHVFKENSGDFRMAAFPDAPLVIPNNLSREASKPYNYGIAWEDIAPEAGNPFYAAHSFYYDTNQSREENRERALQFMRETRRGDFFQMSADYQYGVGAHSLIFTRDYDPASNTVAWTDSNMNGLKRGGLRYGYVQYDAVREIGWFVDAFCQRGRGATLYRLREDITKP
ncbi:MAG: hypothetical protein PHP02_06750 [Eubacteriales bacterium]|nr:hypothetical protein [Eubacteriales bacterium]